jgi:hypothetical protein
MPVEAVHACQYGPYRRREAHRDREYQWRMNLLVSPLNWQERCWYVAVESERNVMGPTVSASRSPAWTKRPFAAGAKNWRVGGAPRPVWANDVGGFNVRAEARAGNSDRQLEHTDILRAARWDVLRHGKLSFRGSCL